MAPTEGKAAHPMGTVAKALQLLTLFDRARPRIGLSELARLSGVNKATCHRLMSELQEFGLVEQLDGSREYRIGPAVLRLAVLRESTVPLREAALPVLQSIAHATGETTHMSAYAGGELITLAFAYSPAHGMKVMMEDADRLPLHATSSGHAVLAHLPEAERQGILGGALRRLTAETPTDRAALEARIAEVRRNGFAETVGTFEADVHSLAVPLFGQSGRCTGALAVAAPAARMTPDLRRTIQRHLTEGARRMTTLAGGTLPADLAAIWQAAGWSGAEDGSRNDRATKEGGP